MEAVGTSEMIRDMRRGRLPSVERLQRLCEVLGLEFYVGPPRSPGSIDERRLEQAVVNTERALENLDVKMDPDAKARIITAIYELLDRGRDAATAERVMRLVDGLMSLRARAADEEPE